MQPAWQTGLCLRLPVPLAQRDQQEPRELKEPRGSLDFKGLPESRARREHRVWLACKVRKVHKGHRVQPGQPARSGRQDYPARQVRQVCPARLALRD